jgi:hypothetical protein
MPHTKRKADRKPRELRRTVVLPARMRSGSGWTDACILNVSSRGLLVHSARTGPRGSQVELWRGDHVIVARVVWRDGARAGLCTEGRLAVEHILSLNRATALQLIATADARGDRCRRAGDSRSRGRTFEFAGIVTIAIALAASVYGMVEQALARPLALVSAALGG